MPRPKKNPVEQVEQLEYKLTASLLDEILKRSKHMSANLDALNAAVSALNAKVDQLIAAQAAGSSDTAALPAITDAVNAEAAKVDAALGTGSVG